jgi:hypothetical protein
MQWVHTSGMRRARSAQRDETGLVGQQGDLMQARQNAVADRRRSEFDRCRDPQLLRSETLGIQGVAVQRQAALGQEAEQDFVRWNSQEQIQIHDRAGHEMSPAQTSTLHRRSPSPTKRTADPRLLYDSLTWSADSMNIVTFVNPTNRCRTVDGSRLQLDARRRQTHRVITLDRQLCRH